MKIAYGILCHTDPNHIGRLAKKLTKNVNSKVFVHVDKKVDITPFENQLLDKKNVYVLSNRVEINWGGYQAIEATINLMQTAKNIFKFDRFVLLQGLEYPIKSGKEIEDFFVKNFDTEFLLAQNISTIDNLEEQHKYRLYYKFGSSSIFWKIINKTNCFLVKKRIVPHLKKNYIRDKQGKKMWIYQGCAQFGITYLAVEYILNFNATNPKFNSYFKTMFAPDEAYFHTIIYNSYFINNTPEKSANL